MRVLLHQSAKGLFSPSGGYRSNLTLLQYLASQGHSVQQIVCAYDSEIQEYIAEEKSKGLNISVRKSQLRTPLTPNSKSEINITQSTSNYAAVVKASQSLTGITVSQFTMRDGVKVVALDASDFGSLFPGDEYQSLT